MSAAILSIGTELTRGELLNSNARWLAERLTALGFEVQEHVTVADDSEEIAATLARLASHVKVVVSTGGLGPTTDDLTSAAVARALGVGLVRDQASVRAIEQRYARVGRELTSATASQADFPAGARVLPNGVGTAPGFEVTLDSARCFFMPGVPREMVHLFERHVEPAVASLAEPTSYQVHVRCYGLGESQVAEKLAELEVGGARHTPGVVLGYRAHFPEIEVKVLARATDAGAARATADAVGAEVRRLLSDVVFGDRDTGFAAFVGQQLRVKGLRLAVAESCTGGLIGKLLTDVPGSSEYLLLDAVTYANQAKVRVLGVDQEVLDQHGAVSEPVAAAMAEGARACVDADLAVAVTGIAGPGGGSEDKPVGTVCFGLALRQAKTRTRTQTFTWERDRVRLASAYAALWMVVQAAREA